MSVTTPIVDGVADLPPWTETEAWLVGYIADLRQTPHRYAGEIRGLEIVLKRLRAALTTHTKAEAVEKPRSFWMHYDSQIGKWIVNDGPPKVVRTGSEIIHVLEVSPHPRGAK